MKSVACYRCEVWTHKRAAGQLSSVDIMKLSNTSIRYKMQPEKSILDGIETIQQKWHRYLLRMDGSR